jgi:hypothetical protein
MTDAAAITSACRRLGAAPRAREGLNDGVIGKSVVMARPPAGRARWRLSIRDSAFATPDPEKYGGFFVVVEGHSAPVAAFHAPCGQRPQGAWTGPVTIPRFAYMMMHSYVGL